MATRPIIAAASVNHNTSAYMELMLRSLFARHRALPSFTLTVFDNDSTDDTRALRAAAAARGVPIVPSGFGLATEHNSHGDILSRFVQAQAGCTHFLFLDADTCFIEDDTISTLVRELDDHPEAFGIGPRLSWDGVSEVPAEARAANPDICDARLHPCCALVRNTPIFRRVVAEVGLMCAQVLWAERAEYLDTFKLMTRVMATHGLRHILSSALVLHFFSVSYPWDPPELTAQKVARRDARLADLRRDPG